MGNPEIDSTPLDSRDVSREKIGTFRDIKIKSFVILFLIFILVMSDIFVSHVVGGFSKAVEGRHTTAYGTILQGIFLVLFYIMFLYLDDCEII